MVTFDATTLMLLLRPDARIPTGRDGRPIKFAADRVQARVDEFDQMRSLILIPTPALAEILVRLSAKSAQELANQLRTYTPFRFESFDVRAAIEVAAMQRADTGGKKSRDAAETYAKLKYDRQIIAIAKVNGCAELYTDDNGMRVVAERAGLTVVSVAELPLPAKAQQTELKLVQKPKLLSPPKG